MTQVTVTEILARWPYLSRVGQEWQGPCPNCGGRDRFHLRTRGDGSALFGCRGCIDDQPTDQKREAFRLIMTRLDLDKGTQGPLKKVPSKWPVKDNPDRNAKKNERILAWVASVWSKGLAIGNTPAHHYLVSRHCLPPPGCKFKRFPMDIRWLPEQVFGDLNRSRPAVVVWSWPPTGCLMYALRCRDGHVQALSFEALTRQGQRPHTRWRKTLGKRKGAWFQPWTGQAGTVIAEGECDALSLGWQYPAHTIIGGGGTSLMKNPELATCLARGKFPPPHSIITDGDDAARKAGRTLWQSLYEKGLFARLEFCHEGEDPASRWENIIASARKKSQSLVDAWHNISPGDVRDA